VLRLDGCIYRTWFSPSLEALLALLLVIYKKIGSLSRFVGYTAAAKIGGSADIYGPTTLKNV
jgi:hypothetical protein